MGRSKQLEKAGIYELSKEKGFDGKYVSLMEETTGSLGGWESVADYNAAKSFRHIIENCPNDYASECISFLSGHVKTRKAADNKKPESDYQISEALIETSKNLVTMAKEVPEKAWPELFSFLKKYDSTHSRGHDFDSHNVDPFNYGCPGVFAACEVLFKELPYENAINGMKKLIDKKTWGCDGSDLKAYGWEIVAEHWKSKAMENG